MIHTLILATAQRELSGREREPDWPSDDTAAWRAIVALLDGSADDLPHDWAALAAAARLAEDRKWKLEAKADDAVKRAALGARIAALAIIRHCLELRAVTAGQLTAAQCGPTILRAAAAPAEERAAA